MRALAASVATCLCTLLAPPLAAQEVETLGYGRLFTNDYFGDRHDRWRSGGYQFSILRGSDWTGDLPARPGGIVEYRLRTEIIAPSVESGGTDRPYAGTISAGLHTHFALGPFDATTGVDLTLVGPATGVSSFQEGFHDIFSLPRPVGVDDQLGNTAHLGAVSELAWPIRPVDALTIRPFVELQAGVETLARVGGDIIVGNVGHRDLLVRDTVTGQLIRAVDASPMGASLLVGGDWARVGDSVFLPQDQGFAALDERWRARAGVHWQIFPEVSVFYGLTYLSEEFAGQPEGQLVGGLKLNFNF